MNNLFQQLQGRNLQAPLSQKPLPSLKSNLSSIQNLLQSSNPSSLIQNMILNNPKMKSIMQAFQSSGMTAKQYFYEYAQQKGIDPDQFLNS